MERVRQAGPRTDAPSGPYSQDAGIARGSARLDLEDYTFVIHLFVSSRYPRSSCEVATLRAWAAPSC